MFVFLTSFKPTEHALLGPLQAPRLQLAKACLRSVVLPEISAACSPLSLNTSIADRWTVTTLYPLHFHLPYIDCYQVPSPPLSPLPRHPSSTLVTPPCPLLSPPPL